MAADEALVDVRVREIIAEDLAWLRGLIGENVKTSRGQLNR